MRNWPFFWNYWLGLGEMVSHRYERAIIHFTRCLDRNYPIKIHVLVYEQLGKCYFDINEIDKSKFYFLKVLEIREGNEGKLNSEVASRLGFIFYQEGNYHKAKYYLELAKANYRKRDYTNIKAVEEYLSKLKNRDYQG